MTYVRKRWPLIRPNCIAFLHHTGVTVAVLLVVFCITFALPALAVSSGYNMDEVKLKVTQCRSFITYSDSVATCSVDGGVLIPDATNAIHAAIKLLMAEYTDPTSFFTYLGGSTLLSSTDGCVTNAATTKCVWYWDVGRYSGVDNAMPFYVGNFHAYVAGRGGLDGSRPVDFSMMYWLKNKNDNYIYPGNAYGQYIMMVRTSSAFPRWIVTKHTSYPYNKDVTMPK